MNVKNVLRVEGGMLAGHGRACQFTGGALGTMVHCGGPMPDRKNFFDELYVETMSEMAGNFFSRRKAVESRLEGFGSIAAEVRSVGGRALKRWRTFFILTLDEVAALRFCVQAGMDAADIPALSASLEPWRFRLPFSMTRSGRYRKSVRYVYEAVRQASMDYLEGAYGTDPRNPSKKILLPNLNMLRELASRINAEVDSVNNCQAPSCVLAYAKSLDPGALEMEAIIGGGGYLDAGKIDRDMAFSPVNLSAMNLPVLPAPPPLETVQPMLDALCGSMLAARPRDARAALSKVAAL